MWGSVCTQPHAHAKMQDALPMSADVQQSIQCMPELRCTLCRPVILIPIMPSPPCPLRAHAPMCAWPETYLNPASMGTHMRACRGCLVVCHCLHAHLLLAQHSPAEDSLKGHRKLDASLKAGPTVKISWMRSSMQMMPCLPRFSSMILLSVRGMRLPFTLP